MSYDKYEFMCRADLLKEVRRLSAENKKKNVEINELKEKLREISDMAD